MLKKLICWLWGHKVVAKVETGETYLVGPSRGSIQRPLKKFEVQPFCLRCSKPNPYYPTAPKVPDTP